MWKTFILTDQIGMTSIITYFTIEKYAKLSPSQSLRDKRFEISNKETWPEAYTFVLLHWILCLAPDILDLVVRDT